MNVILLVISVGLFCFAPQNYSFIFCSLCLGVFLLGAYFVLHKDIHRMGLLNFNMLFLLSFFLCSYAFPVFMYPTGFTGIVGVLVDDTLINVCTAMCTVAGSCYFLGYDNKKIKFKQAVKTDYPSKSFRNTAGILFYIFLVFISVVLVGFIRTEHEVSIEVTATPFAFLLFEICLAILLVVNSYYVGSKTFLKFYNINKVPLIASLIVILVFLFIGDRKPIIEIGIIIITSLSLFYKKIKSRYLLVLLFVAAALMAMIGLTRTSSSSIREGGLSSFVEANREVIGDESTTVWSFFSDLTERYEELYQGYEYVGSYGNQYPLRIIPLLLSPLPLAPNVASELIYDKPLFETAPGAIIGRFWDVHAGTHCVVDIYVPWGLLGVIILFLLFGRLISYITQYRDCNIYYKTIYIIVVSQAVFMPRGSLFDIYRPIVWAVFIIYFSKKK